MLKQYSMKLIGLVGLFFLFISCDEHRAAPQSLYKTKPHMDTSSKTTDNAPLVNATNKAASSTYESSTKTKSNDPQNYDYEYAPPSFEDTSIEECEYDDIEHPVVRVLLSSLRPISLNQNASVSENIDTLLSKESFEGIWKATKEFCESEDELRELGVDPEICTQYLDGGYEPQAWISAKIYSIQLLKFLQGHGVSDNEFFVFPKANWIFNRSELSFYFEEETLSRNEFKEVLMQMLKE